MISSNVQTEGVKRALLRVGPRAFEKMKEGFRLRLCSWIEIAPCFPSVILLGEPALKSVDHHGNYWDSLQQASLFSSKMSLFLYRPHPGRIEWQ